MLLALIPVLFLCMGAALPVTLRAQEFTVSKSVLYYTCLTAPSKLPSTQFFCKVSQAKETAAGGDSGRLLAFASYRSDDFILIDLEFIG